MMAPIFVTLAMTVALLAAGVWVGIALGLSGLVGLTQVLGLDRALDIFGKIVWEQNTNFVLLAIPMFIFMGELLFQSGIMSKVYLRAATLIAGLPGGLLQANIFACTIFAACSGSSVASAATIGSVGYPEISKRGYDRRTALGSIAAGGTLGILIPPSIIFIVYGSLADVSVGKLFLAGLVPGLLMAGLFSLLLGVRCTVDRRLAPRVEGSTLGARVRALAGLWQLAVLIFVVLGGLYAGVASPTEVAALGASLALLFSIASGRFTFAVVWRAGLAAVRQTSMILFIIFTAKTLSMTLIYFRVPAAVVAWVDSHELTFGHIFVAVTVIYLILGMFIEGIAMMVLTIPFIGPVMAAANMDPVWMGVVICILIEVGLLTPPVGLNLFVLQGVTKEPIHDVIAGTMPFLLVQFLMIALLYYWPNIALFVPSAVMGR
jgi:tripartite ATP-independent transporter DctM subunit